MKQLCFAFALFFSFKFSYSQCSPDRPFSSIHGYYINHGFGIEAGLWPVENKPFGAFVGMQFSFSSIESYDPVTRSTSKTRSMDPIFYSRIQYRINRFTHITGALGVNGLDRLYSSIGLRFSAPFGSGKALAMVIDPQITSSGYKLGLGFVFALE